MTDSSRRERLALAGFACAAFAAQVAVFHGTRLDDAYVSFRYGANLARGLGFVFNPGERVMGSTSPGECLLSALVFTLVGPRGVPTAMCVVGCAGWTGQAVLAYRIVRRALGVSGAAIVGAAIALGGARSAAWLPLETNTVAALALFAIERALAGRLALAGALAGLATVFRPDAALLALPLAVLVARTAPRAAWKPALAFLAAVAPWALFATLYFGTPIPRSALVKVHATPLGEYARLALRTVPIPFPDYYATPLAIVLLVWAAAVAGGIALAKRDRRLAVLPAWGALHLVVYVFVLRSGTSFAWHFYPGCLVLVVLVASELASIDQTWSRALAIGYAVFGGIGTLTIADEVRHGFWYATRDALYRDVAAWIDPRAQPEDVLACEEAGTLGWYSPLVVNDQAGLVTPDPLARFHDFLSGRPTALRWVVLNGKQLGPFASVARGRTLAAFERDGAKLWVVDLHEPRDPALGR